MEFSILNISVHLVCFGTCLYALSCIKFDKLCDISKPGKVQLLLLVLALGLGYVCAQFLLAITIFN